MADLWRKLVRKLVWTDEKPDVLLEPLAYMDWAYRQWKDNE